jgi:hypothetical protein
MHTLNEKMRIGRSDGVSALPPHHQQRYRAWIVTESPYRNNTLFSLHYPLNSSMGLAIHSISLGLLIFRLTFLSSLSST